MSTGRFKALVAATLLVASALVSAHRFHAGITDMSFNARSGSTEIVHTYMAHDVEALLANLYGRQFDLSDPEDQDVLRKYVEPRFWLQGQDKARLNTRWVGMTIDAERVVIYQEMEHTPLWKASVVHDAVLVDFLPDQVNTVNLDEGNGVRTLTFNRTVTEQPAR
ncbi:hypothetical protein G4G28_20435 [Massilia sp. Dwa41.01b]|uniref:DUF6702 family protein n=1 Tax=unclassified Massilia TaxID=2609279 RepID=UPI0015FF831B|nr:MULTISPECIES: DUF6702 family protein [unclassified Massilia]QNA90276.1 hypothetical protein G4G28_20435 [Massilia sp. Dwa41.01b]QNB01176.1 hypothetical protein G4G31_24060 [Massilia sp. Se16.2.3]